MDLMLDLPVAAPRRVEVLAVSERRTLGAILAFLAGLAFLGPIAGLAAATLVSAGARLAESR
jgi:hypothetical protein